MIDDPSKYGSLRRYYEKVLIPKCMGIGISYDEFWTLNPRKLNVIYDGYREIQKHEADKMYAEAEYTYAAMMVALGNLFRKKGHKAVTFAEAMERPNVVKQIEEKPMTDDEKRKYTEQLFTNLKLMQANFELSHGGKAS